MVDQLPLNRPDPHPGRPPVPDSYRDLFAATGDTVETWLTYIGLAGTRWIDDDLDDPDLTHYQDWWLELLIERVGWDAVVGMIEQPEHRAPLYERGPHVTGRVASGDTIPLPLSREQIDKILEWLSWRLRMIRTRPDTASA
ncbi:hypothetical protein ACFORH_43355 [Amycolatopsis roodepoortensis]|uniref:Uncharacterized protein n=1 Tax=Amycolatopsis roodepoortensis TaxID=700274 RepID=A0ABR9LJG2_9PSEU|nr:hypothetical protein [Amycolatopsis roodepoortensis]MBE1580420.1 hypothetical protein [Amycolatopsis roodepoortensis]